MMTHARIVALTPAATSCPGRLRLLDAQPDEYLIDGHVIGTQTIAVYACHDCGARISVGRVNLPDGQGVELAHRVLNVYRTPDSQRVLGDLAESRKLVADLAASLALGRGPADQKG